MIKELKDSAAMLLEFQAQLISNRGIRPSLRLRHSQNLCVTFVLKGCDAFHVALFNFTRLAAIYIYIYIYIYVCQDMLYEAVNDESENET